MIIFKPSPATLLPHHIIHLKKRTPAIQISTSHHPEKHIIPMPTISTKPKKPPTSSIVFLSPPNPPNPIFQHAKMPSNPNNKSQPSCPKFALRTSPAPSIPPSTLLHPNTPQHLAPPELNPRPPDSPARNSPHVLLSPPRSPRRPQLRPSSASLGNTLQTASSRKLLREEGWDGGRAMAERMPGGGVSWG